MYSTAPSVKLRGLNPNANIYMICATANIHIPAAKQLGHTNSASPKQLNTNPVNIRLEKAYSFDKLIPCNRTKIMRLIIGKHLRLAVSRDGCSASNTKYTDTLLKNGTNFGPTLLITCVGDDIFGRRTPRPKGVGRTGEGSNAAAAAAAVAAAALCVNSGCESPTDRDRRDGPREC